ncbi:MAG: CarD family transcriptional regulator [Acidobacteria bacterium]|nr:CarD family transcriptional regulator [Acidobacteriota bacterium]
MLFKVGQKVVYPNHGIAIIEQIDSRQINGEVNDFYLLRLHSTNSTVMVPVRNAREVGLRHPIANKQCNELLRVLAEDLTMPEMDWKNRFKDFSDRMRSGDLFLIAEVLKTLTYLNQLKPLSFREKRMLEKARQLVISELASVGGVSEAKIEPKVDAALDGACNKHRTAFASSSGH